MSERKYTIKQIEKAILDGYLELNKQIGKNELGKKDMFHFVRAWYGIMKLEEPFVKQDNCKHRWKYLSGSPWNQLHECLNCGAIA